MRMVLVFMIVITIVFGYTSLVRASMVNRNLIKQVLNR